MRNSMGVCFLTATLLCAPAAARAAVDDGGMPAAAARAVDRQVQEPAPAPPTPRHTGIIATLKSLPHDFRHLVAAENLMWVGIGSGAAAAIHPLDDNINRHFAGTSAEDALFGPGKYIGQTATLAASSLTVYAIGRIRDQPKVSHIGMDLVRALVVDEALTEGLKLSAHRMRPDGSNDRSFPSGHASTTFAVATVLERHLDWKMWGPAYLFSSYVAMSRLHENRHFASDVAFGAAIGIIAGRTVTRPGSDKYALSVTPVHGGFAIIAVKN